MAQCPVPLSFATLAFHMRWQRATFSNIFVQSVWAAALFGEYEMGLHDRGWNHRWTCARMNWRAVCVAVACATLACLSPVFADDGPRMTASDLAVETTTSLVGPSDPGKRPPEHGPCIILEDPQDVGPRGSGERSTHQTNLWPCATVPYVFDANVSAVNRQRALNAMASVEAVSDVRFVAHAGEADYIQLRDADENSSFVGRRSGRQFINVQSWTVRFIIVHELMHALGFRHEHQRQDRNQFIEIHFDRIRDDFAFAFEFRPGGTDLGEYDFDSVMHYDQCAFSACGFCGLSPTVCRTITVLPPFEFRQSTIGQRTRLSTGDIEGLVALYPSAGESPEDAALLAPVDGETTSDTGPLFDWEDAIGAENYTITVDDDADLSSPIFRFTFFSSELQSMDGTFTEGRTYFWRVVANNDCSEGTVLSPGIASFTVGIPSPDCPGDLTGDGVVSTSDLTAFLGAFGSAAGDPSYLPQADQSGDEVVSTTDLTLMLGFFGTSCE